MSEDNGNPNAEQAENMEQPPERSRGRGGSVASLIVGAIVVGVGILLVMSVSVPRAHRVADEAAAAEKSGPESEGERERKDGEQSDAPKENAGEPTGAAGMKSLELDLPNPIHEGTPSKIPKNVRIDEQRFGKRRPPFVAPDGVTNVARGKPVDSSDPFPIIGNLDLVTDGDKEARSGRFVELAPGKQQVTIDLEKRHKICAIVVWHYHGKPWVYRDVVVQLSNDKDFADPKMVYNNDHDNSSGFGVGKDYEYFESIEGELIANHKRQNEKLVMTEPLGTYRYVRLWSNGSTANDLNRYTEVEVWALTADSAGLSGDG